MDEMNRFGVSPIVYSMLHNNIYCFVYLKYRVKCQMSVQMVQWVVGEMVK